MCLIYKISVGVLPGVCVKIRRVLNVININGFNIEVSGVSMFGSLLRIL